MAENDDFATCAHCGRRATWHIGFPDPDLRGVPVCEEHRLAGLGYLLLFCTQPPASAAFRRAAKWFGLAVPVARRSSHRVDEESGA